MGQIYAGVELDQYHQAFEVYGLKVGLAFQMIDDVLGIFGEEKITGKPAGADLREGKKSLLLLEGYKRATASEKLLINSACGKTKITKSEVEEVKGIVKQNGALDWILKQSEDMASEGIEAINELKNTENGRTVELLQNLGKFLAKRDF